MSTFSNFPQSEWHLILDSTKGDLTWLFETYRPALLTFLMRNRNLSREEAEDLLQGFFADKVIERDLLARVDRAKGKFRTFLIVALDRYVVSWIRKETAQKRSPVSGSISHLDDETVLPAWDHSQDAFDVEWARQVLTQTLKKMKQECYESDRPYLWGVFDARVLVVIMGGHAPVSYDDLVERYRFESPAQASNALISSKRMFQRTLREVIGQYMGGASEKQIEQEIAELLDILAAPQTFGRSFERGWDSHVNNRVDPIDG